MLTTTHADGTAARARAFLANVPAVCRLSPIVVRQQLAGAESLLADLRKLQSAGRPSLRAVASAPAGVAAGAEDLGGLVAEMAEAVARLRTSARA